MADPLVMVPGPLMDARIFLPQMLALADLAPLMLPRRVPAASVEALAEAVLAEAPARFALLGHGIGGMVAMEMLRRAPGRITRLALISTDPLPEPANVSVGREAQVVQARCGRLEELLAADAAVADYAARGDCDDLAALLLDMARARGPEGYVAQARALQRRPDQQRTLRTARLPVVLIGGAADPLYPLRRMDFAAGLIAGGRLLALEGIGHLPTLEAPDAVNAALRDWLGAPMMLTQRVG